MSKWLKLMLQNPALKVEVNPISGSPATSQLINLIFKMTFPLFMYNKVETERCREQAGFIFFYSPYGWENSGVMRLNYLFNSLFSFCGENIANLIKLHTKTLNFQKLPLSTEWSHRTVLVDWILSKAALATAGPSAANSFFQPCWVMKVFCQLIISDWTRSEES